MAVRFDFSQNTLIDGRCPDDKIFLGTFGVCYTFASDDITTGEKPDFTPYRDRLCPFVVRDGRLVCDEIETTMRVLPCGDGIVCELSSACAALSAFGVCLPFNFMGKKNGGARSSRFLFQSPYECLPRGILYAYLAKPDGNDVLVAVRPPADGWKMDYAPYSFGHYFSALKLFSQFDRAYGTPRRAHALSFALFPVRDFSDALTRLAAFYGVPFADVDVGGGQTGSKIRLRLFGGCDRVDEVHEGKIRRNVADENGVYTVLHEGVSTLVPHFGDRAGAPVTVYGYADMATLYRRAMDSVCRADLEKTDGNLCEHMCWAPAMLRFLLRFGSSADARTRADYEQKVRALLEVVTCDDAARAVPRVTLLPYAHEGFPAYSTYRSSRIQEISHGITLLCDAYRYFGEETYYDYAVRTMDAYLQNYQTRDGKIERRNGDTREDYTTVTCPMIPLVDMAILTRGKDAARSARYENAATRMAEFLYARGFDFPTEGVSADEAEPDTEEGSIACTALALLYYCKNVENVPRFLARAKKILDFHDAWVIRTPVCHMHGSTLRWWETLWEGDADGPAICAGHAWSIWRAEADWLYGVLRGDERYISKAKNGFMTNLSKIDAQGRMYAIYNVDKIPGGGFAKRSDDVRFALSPAFPRQTDSGLSRYVFVRLCDTFLSENGTL